MNTYKNAHPDYESETLSYIAQTELVADFTAKEILTNEDSVRRLVNRNRNVVVRVYEWVKDKIKTLTTKGGSRENLAYLRKAERMLSKVLNMPTGGVNIGEEDKEIKRQKAETEETSNLTSTVDKHLELLYNNSRFSLQRRAKYIAYDKIGKANIEAIRKKLQNIYAGVGNAVADGIGIEVGTTVFIVDSGKDQGEIAFGVRQRITISNSELRKQRLEALNERAVSKGYVSSELFGRFGGTSDNRNGSGIGRELGAKLSTNQGETEHQQGRVSERNGDSRGRGLNSRFSISVDSEGNSLSEQQQEYFKDSKVRNAAGELTPVYHGSSNEFFVFDRNRMGKGNDQFGAGFYFATDEESSLHYGDKVIKGYLNITKPIVINRTVDGGDLFDVKLTQKQAYEILKRHPKIYDAEESPLGDLFDEYWEVGAKDYMIREAAKNLDSIGLMDSDYTAFRNYPNELHEAIRDVLGYDGIEVRFDNTNEKFYVAWFENQIKQTSNKNPTSNNDIRYSFAKDESGQYNEKKKEEDGNGRRGQGLRRIQSGRLDSGASGGSIRGVADLQKEFGEAASERIASRVEKIVEKSERLDKYTEELARKHAKKIGYEVYFAKFNNSEWSYFRDGRNLFISYDSNPDAIVRMDNGRLNIFAEMTTDKGNTGIIAIELNTVKDINSKYRKYNLVVSAFSAKDNYVRNALQKRADRVEYIKKDLSQVNPQLYEWLAIINERSNGSLTTINSIRDNAENVNRNEQNSDKRFSLADTDSQGSKLSAKQREFFRESAIVDADGKLLKMYHGTAADFTVFDLAESGASNDHTSHIGFWFTPRKAVAENFAEFNANDYQGKKAHVQEVYLNIENPKIYAPTDNSARMEELRTENTRLREQLTEEYTELKETVGRLNYMLYFTQDNIFGRRGENDIGYRVDEDYYVQYMKMSPEQAKKAKSLVDAIKKNNEQIKKNETEYYRLQDNDSFLQMSDDLDEFMEWITGTHAHERGFGREHYAATNAREAAEQFRNKLIKEGYDGIWIKDTRVDDSGDQVVAFFPEQIKLTSNKTPSNNPDIRYSISAVDDYTEKQYNDYGWVRVNDVLSVNEYTDFNNKLNNLTAEIRRNRTKDGEYIIAVNDLQGDRFGVNNVLVFAKGTYQNPKITRVIRIGLDNETDIEIIRSDIYEWEAWDSTLAGEIVSRVYSDETVRQYTAGTFQNYRESKAEWRRQGSRIESGRVVADSREVQDGAGDSRSGRGNVRYSISENQNTRDENYVNNKLKMIFLEKSVDFNY